jgi:hypothetical protein
MLIVKGSRMDWACEEVTGTDASRGNTFDVQCSVKQSSSPGAFESQHTP